MGPLTETGTGLPQVLTVSVYGVHSAGGKLADPGYEKYNKLLIAAVADAPFRIVTNLNVSVAPGARFNILYDREIALSDSAMLVSGMDAPTAPCNGGE